jgi:hypothetical protein
MREKSRTKRRASAIAAERISPSPQTMKSVHSAAEETHAVHHELVVVEHAHVRAGGEDAQSRSVASMLDP